MWLGLHHYGMGINKKPQQPLEMNSQEKQASENVRLGVP